jgi:hypothetical protein
MKWGGYRSSIAKTKAIIMVAHAILIIMARPGHRQTLPELGHFLTVTGIAGG